MYIYNKCVYVYLYIPKKRISLPGAGPGLGPGLAAVGDG